MKLSILIPTLPDRYALLKRLQGVLNPQVANYPGEVEIKYNDAGRSITTGQKRNLLIASATGEYFAFIDDDDLIPSFYVKEMIKAINQSPDVVTFKGFMLTNGENRKNFTIKLGEKYEERDGHYYRFPNHLCAFRKSLVQNVKFPHISMQEDYQWAREINRQKLLKTEVHIDKEMYQYLFISNKRK